MSAYPLRTLASLATQARAFFTQTIPGAIASVWPNTFTVTGKVMALIDFENELRRGWLYRQQFASTAAAPALYRHGWELGLGGPVPATFAVGTATVSCAAGVAIPAGVRFQRGDGMIYTTRAGMTPPGVSVALPIQALAAGAAGNCEAGTALTLVDAAGNPDGLGTTGTVDAQDDGGGCEGGSDAETLEHYRQRVLLRKRQPPTGGSAPDYQEWTRAALPSAAAVFVDSFVNDTRWVWVSFLVDDQPNGIPSDGQVAIVQAYLSDPIRRPVTARVQVVKPTAMPVDITVSGLDPDTPATRQAVEDELAAVFAERVRPAMPSSPFTLFKIWLDGALDRAEGVVSADMPTPSGDQVFSTAPQMPVLGPVTFV